MDSIYDGFKMTAIGVKGLDDILLLVNKPDVQSQNDNECIVLTSIVCVFKA